MTYRATAFKILRPFRDPSREMYHADEYFDEDDTWGPDEAIREIVSDALKELGLNGMGACRLCCG